MKPTRRQFGAGSLLALGPGAAAGASLVHGAPPPERPLNVVCIGGHPDDPESGTGGTLALYASLGHKVTVVYLTRGERGIKGKSSAEAGSIRSAEADAACRVIGARAVFAGQINGEVELNEKRVVEMATLLKKESPDVVLAHWPIDSHLDHQIASILAMRATRSVAPAARLYFFEVNLGEQTRGFLPTDYVDVGTVREKKKAALFFHKSQDGEKIYRDHHEPMENLRGRESGVTAAEAFVRLDRLSADGAGLPGLIAPRLGAK